MMETIVPTYVLSNGVEIPKVGFGTWQTPDGKVAVQAVKDALEAGYRHIDTAQIYGNEESVGQAIQESEVERSEIFLTTKLWNDHHSYKGVMDSFDESLDKLKTDYVDLFLIHWPNPKALRDRWEETNAETWRAMEELYRAKKVRAIGVSNFRPHHLEALAKTADINPMVDQLFINPSDMEPDTVDYCNSLDILVEAYSPLGTGKIFQVPELKELAEKYQRSVAQLVLRWSLQHGFLPLPKSVHRDRIRENIQLFDFAIEPDDMKTIDGLKGCAGSAKDPDQRDF
jgi:diketogulonate reductase-like aldo/keto reductase